MPRNDSQDQYLVSAGHGDQPDFVTGTPSSFTTAGATFHIDHIETVPMTDEQYRLAVRALAELITEWKRAQNYRSEEHGDAA